MSLLSDQLTRAHLLIQQSTTGLVNYEAMAKLQTELAACAENARVEYEHWYLSLPKDERRDPTDTCQELEAILVIERLASLIQDININVEIYERVIRSLQETSFPSDASRNPDT